MRVEQIRDFRALLCNCRRLGTAALLLCSPVLFVSWAPAAVLTWQGGIGGSWTAAGADNWGAGVGAYPGDASHSGDGFYLNDGAVVTLNGNLPNPVGNQWASQSYVRGATLNIQGDLTSLGSLYVGDARSSTISHSAGTMTQSWRFDLGRSGANVNSAYQTRYDMSGSAVLNITTLNYYLGYGVEGNGNRAYLTLADSASMTFSAFAGAGWNWGTLQASDNATVGASGTINMNTAGSILDVSGNATVGFNAFNTQGTIQLGSLGNAISVTNLLSLSLATDLSYQPADMSAGSSELFSYGSLAGTFAGVNVAARSTLYTGVFTEIGDLSAGEYYLDYGDGSSDFITLYYGEGVIPEPGTLALLALGSGLLVAARRIRLNEARRSFEQKPEF
jgi:hypothetical protein